ncbi:MAG: hypothetical protein ACI4T8_00035, partial [Christensenellales bacterium]
TAEKTEQNARTHTIAINYENKRLYFDYNGIKGTFSTEELAKSKETIDRLLNYIPELKDILDQLLEGINTNINSYDLGSIIKSASNYDENRYVALALNLSTMSSLLTDIVRVKINVENGIVSLYTNPTINLFGYNFNANAVFSVATDEEASYTLSDTTGYIVFDTINNLLETTANTAEMRHFRITGDAQTSILSFDIKISIDCYLDINELKQVSMKCILYHDDSSLAFENKTCQTILYVIPGDSNIYYEKTYKTKGFLGIGSKTKTEYGKFTNDQFASDPVKGIVYLLDINETIANLMADQITGSDNVEIYLEKIFKNYSYNEDNNEYSIDLSLSSINSSLGDANVKIYHTEDNKLDRLSATISVINLLTLEVNGNIADYNNQDYGTYEEGSSFIAANTFSNLY